MHTYLIASWISWIVIDLFGTNYPKLITASPRSRPASAAGLPSTTSVIHRLGSSPFAYAYAAPAFESTLFSSIVWSSALDPLGYAAYSLPSPRCKLCSSVKPFSIYFIVADKSVLRHAILPRIDCTWVISISARGKPSLSISFPLRPGMPGCSRISHNSVISVSMAFRDISHWRS